MMFELGVTLPEAGIIENLGRHSNERKGLAVMAAQDFSSVINSAVFCFIAAYGMLPDTLPVLCDALEAICDYSYTPVELLSVGERITNLQRAYNLKNGLGSRYDRLPSRLLEPVPDGPNAGKSPDLDYILQDYYRAREWDRTGVPTREKLSALGLDEIAQDLGV
jgi:aldehyde:ferredoxin oxidoreductase